MKFDKRHRNTFFSVLLFIILCSLVFAINWDADFAGAGLVFVTDLVGLMAGLYFILLKLFKINVSKTNFIYNYFGVLNLILGLLILRILFSTGFTIILVVLLLLHLFIGLFILYDIFRKQRLPA